MGTFRADVGCRYEDVPRQVALDVKVPLLHISGWMISHIGNGGILHHLTGVLLGAQSAQRSANWRNDAGQEWCIDGVDWDGAVNRSVVRRGGVVHQIVIGVQTEGDVVRNEE